MNELQAGTIVILKTTNGGEAVVTLISLYRETYSLECQEFVFQVPSWRIKSVTPYTPTDEAS